ncbi:MAG: hypothetical protein LBE76_00955 [Nitrososphaerota archaeon]|nr:hypothetical protein [Nitrososphaerota archaeon]
MSEESVSVMSLLMVIVYDFLVGALSTALLSSASLLTAVLGVTDTNGDTSLNAKTMEEAKNMTNMAC